MSDAPVADLRLAKVGVGQDTRPSLTVDVDPLTLNNVAIDSRRWTRDYLHSLPGADSIDCDKWAVRR